MEEDVERRLVELIPANMAERGRITIESLLAPVKDIMNRRRFPENSLSDLQIRLMLEVLSSMDSDKDPVAARVGEREGRVASPLVQELAAGFNHGIGRSGHVTAPQPKAPGASLMQQIANAVATDAVRRLGLPNVRHGIVTPLSTGMSIALVLGALRRELGIRQVLFPRIDHKSPHRAIGMAGLDEVKVSTVLEGEAVRADLSELEGLVASRKDCAILTTTTFFPPRESDPVKEIAKLCAGADVPLVINNAYGVQSSEVMSEVRSAIDAGRVDAIIQSSDKNFMAPVGGSIIVAPEEQTIEWTAATYAGRATAAPVVQTLSALLALGLERYRTLQREQTENKSLLKKEMGRLSDAYGQRVLDVQNPVAHIMTADGLDVRELGARLYTHRVTGPRAVERGAPGSCFEDYPHSYLVMNAAIGVRKVDIEEATTKLDKELAALK